MKITQSRGVPPIWSAAAVLPLLVAESGGLAAALQMASVLFSGEPVRRVTLMVLLLALACKSPEEKAQKARDELSSWSGAGAVLSQQWSRGKLARPYIKSTLAVASDSLKGLADPLKDDEKAKAQLWRVTQLFDELSRAVANDHRAAAAPLSPQFAAIGKALQKK